MTDTPERLVEELLESCIRDQPLVPTYSRPILELSELELAYGIRALSEAVDRQQLTSTGRYWEELILIFHAWQLRAPQSGRGAIPETLRGAIVGLYQRLTEANPNRYRLLQWLIASSSDDDLTAFAEILCDDPPRTPEAAAETFSPLMTPASGADRLFPRLVTCLTDPVLAAPILDLANFVFREGQKSPKKPVSDVPTDTVARQGEEHPLSDEKDSLIRMLSGITQKLEQLQTLVPSSKSEAETAREESTTAVALAVALCDTLALIGSDQALAALSHALELQHRRIHVEAATALARFGDEDGIRTLLQCAADPATRLRALRYSEELDLYDRIDDIYTAGPAVAEAEFFSYLMQPSVMGVAPTQCELVDDQTLYWPGYDEPRQCYLFRYSYIAVDQDERVQFHNLGIAGPMVHIFPSDLLPLDMDDVYAAYAGWYAQHPEIVQSPIGQATRWGGPVERLTQELESQGFGRIQPILQGNFFGTDAIAVVAEQDQVPGTAVADGETVLWYPATESPRPITPEVAYCIYKGRRLLRQFN